MRMPRKTRVDETLALFWTEAVRTLGVRALGEWGNAGVPQQEPRSSEVSAGRQWQGCGVSSKAKEKMEYFSNNVVHDKLQMY